MKKGEVRILDMTWTGSNGRTWEVVCMEKPGVYMVRTTDRTRFGSMRAIDIRNAYEQRREAQNA